MINRRLIRAKVLQITYAFFKKSDISIQQAERELKHSLEKTLDLYYLLHVFLLETIDFAKKLIEIRKNKNIQSEEDINPNERFVNNKVAEQILKNDNFSNYLKDRKLSWLNYPELVKKAYKNFVETEAYNEYMSQEESSFRSDRRIIKYFFEEFLYNFEDLYENIEEQSIYWNSDIDYVISKISSSLKDYKKSGANTVEFPVLFKKKDDEEFAFELLYKSIFNSKENEKIITDHIQNWEFERISHIDRLIMQIAITEVMEFPSIPIKVTINEYVEIAKKYGGEKSSGFINGVLDRAVKQLNKDEKFKKTGRGLL